MHMGKAIFSGPPPQRRGGEARFHSLGPRRPMNTYLEAENPVMPLVGSISLFILLKGAQPALHGLHLGLQGPDVLSQGFQVLTGVI